MNGFSLRDAALLTARLGLSLLFLIMGWGKLSDFSGAVTYMLQSGAPFPTISALIATMIEIGAGLALVFGIMTPPVALLLAGYTLVTGLIGHHFWTYNPGMMRYDMTIHFYKNMSIAGGLLALAAAGSGRYALQLGRMMRLPGRLAG